MPRIPVILLTISVHMTVNAYLDYAALRAVNMKQSVADVAGRFAWRDGTGSVGNYTGTRVRGKGLGRKFGDAEMRKRV
jgi:hypothetical protein